MSTAARIWLLVGWYEEESSESRFVGGAVVWLKAFVETVAELVGRRANDVLTREFFKLFWKKTYIFSNCLKNIIVWSWASSVVPQVSYYALLSDFIHFWAILVLFSVFWLVLMWDFLWRILLQILKWWRLLSRKDKNRWFSTSATFFEGFTGFLSLRWNKNKTIESGISEEMQGMTGSFINNSRWAIVKGNKA